MKVLHIHSGNVFGGVERMLEALAPATAGRTPIASSFALCFDGQVSDTLRAAGGDLYSLGDVRARRPDHVWRARARLRDVLMSTRWDVACVHSSWSQALFGSVVKPTGIPLVRWLHAPQSGPRWLECWAEASPPELVLCNSRYTKENTTVRFGSAPLAVHYPPAVLPSTPAGTGAVVRAELGTAPDDVVVALVARLEAGKGHALLIDALAEITALNWEAWIIGGVQRPAEEGYLAALRSRAATTGLGGRVRFLGQRRDVAWLLAGADLYCQPNQAPDSFGFSFVEAMAAGLPVVTTRMGAAPEIIDESCGLLVEPGSLSSVVAALRCLIGQPDERRVMSVAARARAATLCDVPASVSRLARELSDAVNMVPAV